MLEAAKEGILAVQIIGADGVLSLAADPAELETRFTTTRQLRKNSRLGMSSKNPVLHRGSSEVNSTTALGMQPVLRWNGIRSRYTGKERDSESGLDNFGARYDSSQYGRFMTPDPVLSTPVHIINPQRWNKYAYAVNNPLWYVDPDGRDAIAVNFSKEIPIAGHEGIISVHSDGSATYARFGPEHADMPVDIGKATETPLDTKVTFGQNGLPTPDSYAALTKEVATKENPAQDPNSIRMNYFKTSEADTVMLDNWMKAVQGDSGPYICFAKNNCAGFTAAGLLAGHAIDYPTASSLSIFPNEEFWQLYLISNDNYTPPRQQEKVTDQICSSDDNGKIWCQ